MIVFSIAHHRRLISLEAIMTVQGFNGVVDVSHHNSVSSFSTVKSDGIVAVIHKATEGSTYQDPQYPSRRTAAKSAGLLWGSYHFATASDVQSQLDNYLGYADPSANDLICIDYESSSSGTMSLAQLEDFVTRIHQKLGRYPVVYGGSLLRENLQGVTSTVLSSCPLWFARYSSQPSALPSAWSNWTLWQYTDGQSGPEPHTVNGIGNCDRDTFNGTAAELQAQWPLTSPTS
ncbi:glycoside hydrolase family 25 protein [Azospirillum lipoferum]|nr:glycoside hydrolase family 25 protein [Azospirillum lipoferum]